MKRYDFSTRAFAAILVLGITGSAVPAQAQEGVVGALMRGIGLAPDNRPPIDYNDRPPLVLPPDTNTLPPPVDPASVASNPAWPQDPDVLARQRAEIERTRPAGTDMRSRMAGENTLLSAEEVRTQGRADTGGFDGPVDNTARTRMLTPDELRRGNSAMVELNKAPDLKQRTRLTQPPTAYLEPSPNAPLVPEGEKPDTGKRTWLQRLNPF